jgi:hypothetical protein
VSPVRPLLSPLSSLLGKSVTVSSVPVQQANTKSCSQFAAISKTRFGPAAQRAADAFKRPKLIASAYSLCGEKERDALLKV